jgi:DNA (cytosine-5)-methyltransferase 1
VVAAAEAARPEWLVVENVPQFAQWQLFEAWQNALTTLGYRVERATLNAADFGVAQERRRLIIVGRYQRAPRVLDHLPETTPWVPMRSILDPAASDWKPVAGKSDRVRERVSRSRKRHGDHFMTQHVRDHMGRSLDQPMPTITTADQYAIVRGDMMRTLTIGEQLRAQGFEADYFEGVRMTRKEACRLIGNAIPPQLAEGVISTIAAA